MARALKPISATHVGENGQITIPDEYRKAHHLKKDSLLLLIQFGDVLMLVPPVKALTEICHKIQSALKGQGITVESAQANLQAVRARRFKERFGRYLLLLLLAALGPIAGEAWGAAGPPIVLWPAGAPGAVGQEPADIPTLTPYLPPREKASGAAIVVCPGGGYGALAAHEGEPVAEWLNSLGIAGFVLKYRIAPRYKHPSPMQDAARALRTVRARAAEWGLHPDRIGILGFSAGGHLASTAGTHFDAGRPDASDPIERVSSRPDLMILIYPVITMREKGHSGSRRNLLGPNPTPEQIALLSNEEQVTKGTPPAFLVHTLEDTGVPYENSLLFIAALRRAGVPHEFHLYERGRHGFGLGTKDPILSSWPRRAADWLGLHGFTTARAGAGAAKTP